MKTIADAVHWADVIAENLLKENGKHPVVAGIIPSGSINISNVREAVTADAVYRALLDRSEDVDFICIADNFDPLHTVYPFLPESYIEHVGSPSPKFPAPVGLAQIMPSIFLNLLLKP